MTRKITIIAVLAALVASWLVPVRAAQTVTEQDRHKARYIFLEANNEKLARNMDAFYDLCRRAHELDPENTTISFYLGFCKMTMDRASSKVTREALELMRSHCDAYPGDYFENLYYADVCAALKDSTEAMRVLTRLVEYNPEKVELQMRLASWHTKAGNYNEALDVYRHIELVDGESMDIAAKKIDIYEQMNDTVGAINEMRRALAKAPDNCHVNLNMGIMYMQYNNSDSALYFFNRAQQLDPESGLTYLLKAEYYHSIGDSIEYDNQINHALLSKDLDIETKQALLTEFVRSILSEGDSPQRVNTLFATLIEQHPHEAEIHHLYSEYLTARQDYDGAAEQLGYALDVEPDNAEFWKSLVLINLIGENYEAAVTAGEKALEYNPEEIDLYLYLGSSCTQMKRYDTALDFLNRGIAIVDSTDFESLGNFYLAKGDLLVATGDTVQAFSMYEQAFRYAPGNATLLNNYAYFLSVAGQDLNKAERMAAMAVNMQPESGTFLDTYAWVFFKQQDYTMALFYIRSAIKHTDDDDINAEVLEHYGDILFFNDEPEQALEQWQKALELEPENDRLKRKVEEKTYFEH